MEGYNSLITWKKIGIDAGIVILTGLVIVWQNDVKYIAVIPVLTGMLNWLKHRND